MADGVADDYEPNGKEMFRLYLDLLVNRVIDLPQLENLLGKMDKNRRLALEKSVPAPQSYPAVSGNEVPEMVAPSDSVSNLRPLMSPVRQRIMLI